jgi:multiple sugar transport system substrate-binding protein
MHSEAMHPREKRMKRLLVAASAALLLATGFTTPRPARAQEGMVFMSTQLRPIEEAQRVRNVILKDFPGKVDFVPEQPPELTVRVQAEMQGGTHTISLLGALHGELQPLVPMGALAPLDDILPKLADRGIPASLMALGKYGGQHQMYIPWMQATYIMIANKKALPYLPAGADPQTLTYAQLEQWGKNIEEKTGKRMIGFPAGPTGLMPRFFEGYLYPSFTGGLVVPFRSAAAEQMWTQFKSLWQYVNPNSTNYGFMQEPLLSGDVWIAWDHVARLQDVLRQHPDDYITFPAPAGPKGRGFMPVAVGLAISKFAPDPQEAAQLIEYLTQPSVQLLTLKTSFFFPVVKTDLPSDLAPGIRLAAAAIATQQNSKDALVSLLPVGLGAHSGQFDKIFPDTFQRIVLRGQDVKSALNVEAQEMNRVLKEANAPCWTPDPASTSACQAQ